ACSSPRRGGALDRRSSRSRAPPPAPLGTSIESADFRLAAPAPTTPLPTSHGDLGARPPTPQGPPRSARADRYSNATQTNQTLRDGLRVRRTLRRRRSDGQCSGMTPETFADYPVRVRSYEPGSKRMEVGMSAKTVAAFVCGVLVASTGTAAALTKGHIFP